MDRAPAPTPPAAPSAADLRLPPGPGGRRDGDPPDPYAWMRDHDLPAMRDYLAAERAYYDRETAPARGLQDTLLREMTGRVAAAEDSVSWRRGAFWYFTRVAEGQELEQFCRVAGSGSPAEVLLDSNLLLRDPACAGGYVDLGVREVSPDGQLLAYSADFTGDELFELRVRDLATGQDLPDRIDRTYYGLAWAADSRSLFYVLTDELYRPCEVWLHELGTDPSQDVRVFREDDERFALIVRATRSGGYVLIETESRNTTETLFVPADAPRTRPAVLEPRRPGTEYRADHADGPDGGAFYLVTNDGAGEFRLVRAPVRDPGRASWAEVIAESADTRLESCHVFGPWLVVAQRHAATPQLRVLNRETGEQRLIEAGGPQYSLALGINEDYAAAAVTVRTESLVDPPSWHDVDLATGRWQLRKRKEVPDYDPSRYVTERVGAPAPDGTLIPVTVAYRRGLRRDGSAACLLNGYGAYEDCFWPEFSVATPSLLDRGAVYAVAHIRGGGEGGRRWWLQGRLDRKRNTFTDFIAAADMLAADGWTAPDRIVSRGRSAGGLLQGAVFSMAPRRWRAVVAEVPFVDCVTTMSDPAIPLTINEWDEWGDPRDDPAMRAYLRSYSPYDNVPPPPWPDLLVTGSVHDSRVLIREPAKWVARLRAAAADRAVAGGADESGADEGDAGGNGRLLFRPELGAGAHMGPTGRYDKLRYEAEVLAFVVTAARMRAAPSA
jgi:oligopeptidase B